MFFFDPLFLVFAIPGLILSLVASYFTKSTFAKYSRFQSRGGMTGAQAAQMMLERNGVHGVSIEPVGGHLTDHYDPRSRTLRLSESVYSSRSLAAIGVACHEAGHALQHAQNYLFLGLRSTLVPITNFGSSLAPILFTIGILFMYLAPRLGQMIILLGCVVFLFAVIFSIITLPVEWNASARAKQAMVHAGIVSPQESSHAGRVLNAAFLTYVAATVSAIMTLLYYLYRSGLLGGRRD